MDTDTNGTGELSPDRNAHASDFGFPTRINFSHTWYPGVVTPLFRTDLEGEDLKETAKKNNWIKRFYTWESEPSLSSCFRQQDFRLNCHSAAFRIKALNSISSEDLFGATVPIRFRYVSKASHEGGSLITHNPPCCWIGGVPFWCSIPYLGKPFEEITVDSSRVDDVSNLGHLLTQSFSPATRLSHPNGHPTNNDRGILPGQSTRVRDKYWETTTLLKLLVLQCSTPKHLMIAMITRKHALLNSKSPKHLPVHLENPKDTRTTSPNQPQSLKYWTISATLFNLSNKMFPFLTHGNSVVATPCPDLLREQSQGRDQSSGSSLRSKECCLKYTST